MRHRLIPATYWTIALLVFAFAAVPALGESCGAWTYGCYTPAMAACTFATWNQPDAATIVDVQIWEFDGESGLHCTFRCNEGTQTHWARCTFDDGGGGGDESSCPTEENCLPQGWPCPPECANTGQCHYCPA